MDLEFGLEAGRYWLDADVTSATEAMRRGQSHWEAAVDAIQGAI